MSRAPKAIVETIRRARIADTEIVMVEQTSHTLTANARRLACAVWLLYAAVILTAGDTMFEYWRK